MTEEEGTRNVAKTMSDRDLEWQIKNQKRLGIPGRLNRKPWRGAAR